MGGKVFAALNAPRMAPVLYQRMTQECQSKLKVFFAKVVVPRDAPNKPDHGDIDFLVGGVLTPFRGVDLWKCVEGALGAEYRIARGESQSYAIPHPEVEDAYIQVDVELAPGDATLGANDLFEWTKFMKGDADLVQIIGITHRTLGLVCNDRGLHLRIEEIEPYDKKKALIFLTREPDRAIRFYDFNVDKYRQGFQTENEIFDWIAAGRFFSPQVFEKRVEKADDRSRKRKRPMYRNFVDNYMTDQHRVISKVWTRQEVLHEAIEEFDVKDEYDEKISAHRAEELEDQLWRDIKDVLPQSDKSRKSTIKALRRWVTFEHSQPVISDRPFPTVQPQWSQFVDESTRKDVLAWVEQNWQEVNRRNQTHEENKVHSW
ncbi:hypothetical protein E8E13_008542 [Curvularia kusanoi]|uniref:Uncharacterized protein n=1 Tax=Curvularia kusanoi TaxID=90978 RepID=A0A9P4TM79_CURKU|nr:hypothetical protein E8E13_008542 [Curvularia kusanoi]